MTEEKYGVQQWLFPLREVVFEPEQSNEEKFNAFHQENPHVFSAIVHLAREARAAGAKHWSMKGIFEVLRWSSMTTNGKPWKLNNNYTAYYSRLVMRSCLDLRGFFELRGDGVLVEEEIEDGPEIPELFDIKLCPHDLDPAECDACMRESDFAYDCARESRIFGGR